MNGKLFLQIVLLIVIAAIVLTAVRIGTKCMMYGSKGKGWCPKMGTQQTMRK